MKEKINGRLIVDKYELLSFWDDLYKINYSCSNFYRTIIGVTDIIEKTEQFMPLFVAFGLHLPKICKYIFPTDKENFFNYGYCLSMV